MKIAIIGAGLGGLSAACLLAYKDHEVTLFEKNDSAGGKINQIEAKGFRFDTGPSLLTMPGVLKNLFKQCGESLEDYLSLQPVNPICRYFYQDGTVFNCHKDLEKIRKEIRRIAPEDVEAYQHFLKYAASLYELTKDAFLFNPLYTWNDLRSLNLSDVFKIDALKTVSKRVDTVFTSPHMRQFFKRFSTYNGSSPYKAPATLNVIPHVELSIGGFYIDGGMYSLIKALMQLAEKIGVRFHFKTEIQSIKTKNKRVIGLKTKGDFFPSELVISNSDAHETYLNMLAERDVSFIKRKRFQKVEPSCSGLVLLLGIDRTYEQLSHHTIFFSNDYESEFDAIFNRKIMPNDPTIYVANTSVQNPGHAIPGGSNLFVLINAPYLSDDWNWEKEGKGYENNVINKLQNRGLKGLKESIVYQHKITPVDFYTQYRSNKGSIYGTSSNGKMAAFMRPKNKARNIKGLYLVGGSTHPGGGIPLVILSAMHAVELIQRYEYSDAG